MKPANFSAIQCGQLYLLQQGLNPFQVCPSLTALPQPWGTYHEELSFILWLLFHQSLVILCIKLPLFKSLCFFSLLPGCRPLQQEKLPLICTLQKPYGDRGKHPGQQMPHPLSADTDVLRGTSRIYRETIDRLTSTAVCDNQSSFFVS